MLLDKIGVVGLLRCRSLTLKSRQSRQVPAGAMSPLVTPSPFILEADLFQFRTLEYCGHVEAILVVSHTDDLLVVLISLGLAFLKV